jgi:hypothetical protein
MGDTKVALLAPPDIPVALCIPGNKSFIRNANKVTAMRIYYMMN